MGTWGVGIGQSDVAADVRGEFEDALKAGRSAEAATHAVRSKFAEAITDPDDGPPFWLALADVQWRFGHRDRDVLQHVRDDFLSGRSLAAWREDARGLARRTKVLETFIRMIEVPNPKPRKPPKLVVRKPLFTPGDCLSVRLPAGPFAAALVLAADHSRAEYGKNLIGVLDYLEPVPPPLAVFASRRWLIRTHHQWRGKPDLAWYMATRFREAGKRIGIVGRTEIRPTDPGDSDTYSGWDRLGEQVAFQREWDQARR